MKKSLQMLLAATALAVGAGSALAEPFDDGQSKTYYETLQGKRIGFVPLSMGFDLTEGWYAGLKNQADALGYEILVRDPNWNVEAGTQAANGLIAEKPDILILHPLDMQAFNRIVPRALAAGINVIQINMKSITNGDVFVGTDWYEMGEKQTQAVVDACSPKNGKNGKIAIVQGNLATPTATIAGQAADDVLARNPDITVVATQAADWDASKAHAVTSTILKQHPDLCGILGLWDGQDVGTAAAIREAGLQGKVFLVSSGGGSQDAACDNITNGNFDAYYSYDVPGQARDLNSAVKMLLQTRPEPGTQPFALYTPLKLITRENMTASSCWTLEEQRRTGG